eukprot:1072496-Prymnesium_polylepis.1
MSFDTDGGIGPALIAPMGPRTSTARRPSMQPIAERPPPDRRTSTRRESFTVEASVPLMLPAPAPLPPPPPTTVQGRCAQCLAPCLAKPEPPPEEPEPPPPMPQVRAAVVAVAARACRMYHTRAARGAGLPAAEGSEG